MSSPLFDDSFIIEAAKPSTPNTSTENKLQTFSYFKSPKDKPDVFASISDPTSILQPEPDPTDYSNSKVINETTVLQFSPRSGASEGCQSPSSVESEFDFFSSGESKKVNSALHQSISEQINTLQSILRVIETYNGAIDLVEEKRVNHAELVLIKKHVESSSSVIEKHLAGLHTELEYELLSSMSMLDQSKADLEDMVGKLEETIGRINFHIAGEDWHDLKVMRGLDEVDVAIERCRSLKQFVDENIQNVLEKLKYVD